MSNRIKYANICACLACFCFGAAAVLNYIDENLLGIIYAVGMVTLNIAVVCIGNEKTST